MIHDLVKRVDENEQRQSEIKTETPSDDVALKTNRDSLIKTELPMLIQTGMEELEPKTPKSLDPKVHRMKVGSNLKMQMPICLETEDFDSGADESDIGKEIKF